MWSHCPRWVPPQSRTSSLCELATVTVNSIWTDLMPQRRFPPLAAAAAYLLFTCAVAAEIHSVWTASYLPPSWPILIKREFVKAALSAQLEVAGRFVCSQVLNVPNAARQQEDCCGKYLLHVLVHVLSSLFGSPHSPKTSMCGQLETLNTLPFWMKFKMFVGWQQGTSSFDQRLIDGYSEDEQLQQHCCIKAWICVLTLQVKPPICFVLCSLVFFVP